MEDAPGVPRTRVYGKQSLWPGPRWSPEACDAGRSHEVADSEWYEPTDTELDEEALRALTVEPALPAPDCRAGGESFSDFEFSVLHTSTPSSSVIEGEHAKGVYVWPGDLQELTHALHEEHQGWQRMVDGILSEVPASEDDGQRLGKELQEAKTQLTSLESLLGELEQQWLQRHMRLCSLAASGEEPQAGGTEVLQTRTVGLSEVRKDLAAWKEAIQSEYDQITKVHKAVRVVKKSDLHLEPNYEKMETVPGKLVTVIKAPDGKRKARLVVCGNLVSGNGDHGVPEPSKADLYAGGIDATSLRATLRKAAHEGWDIGCTDVRTAFLLAPRTRTTHPMAMTPPRVVVDAGICRADEMWIIDKALYGLTTSPADWGAYRDQILETFAWTEGSCSYRLQPTVESSVWKIMVTDSSESSPREKMKGLIGIYVDDVLATGPRWVTDAFFNKLQGTWKCATPEYVGRDKWLKFCGMELRWSQDGQRLHLAQPAYIGELLRRHNVEKGRWIPCSKIEIAEDEVVTSDLVRQAQAVTGEILWLAVRTRPDLSYAVSRLGHLVTRAPQKVLQAGRELLEYLHNTRSYGLTYGPCSGDRGGQDLAFLRSMKRVEVHSNISYMPDGQRSHHASLGYYGGELIQWQSGRQAFGTLSTAESELIGYCESMIVGDSLCALLNVLEGDAWQDRAECDGTRVLYGDNTAAISIVANPGGQWRTRHLRLRAQVLRERVKEGVWQLKHLPGSQLAADVLTKPILSRVGWTAFYQRVGLMDYDEVEARGSVPTEATVGGGRCSALSLTKISSLGLALGSVAMMKSSAVKSVCLASLALGLVWEAGGFHSRANELCRQPSRTGDPGRREQNGPLGMIKKLMKMPRENEPGTKEPLVGHRDPARENEPSREEPLVGHRDPASKNEPSREEPLVGQLRVGSSEMVVVGTLHSGDAMSYTKAPGMKGGDGEWVTSACSLKALRLNSSPPERAMSSLEVWELPEMMTPPSRTSDVWTTVTRDEKTYYVRVHGARRLYQFDPRKSKAPFQVEDVLPQRITVLFFPDGEKTVNHSMWKEFEPRRVHAGWTGFSIFEKKPDVFSSAPQGDGPEFQAGYRRGSIAERAQKGAGRPAQPV